jgi:alkylation response protein AidB-like acyl-CoA dehydrogenase
LDLSLSDEQRTIQETAQRFARERLAPRSLQADEIEELPIDVLQQAGAMKYGAMYVAQGDGGAGFTRLDGVLAFEALAYGDPAVATFMSVHNMATWAMWFYGAPEVSGPWLSRLVSFDTIAGFCLTEPDAGSDLGALQTTGRRIGDAVVIDGKKAFITGGGAAGVYVVAARSGRGGPKGISLYIVPGDSPGITIGPPERKMGWRAQPTSRIDFAEVRVSADALLGSDGLGFAIAMRALDGGRLNIAACSIGGAQAALDQAGSLHDSSSGLRTPTGGVPGAPIQAGRYGDEAASGARFGVLAAWRLDSADRDASMFCAMAKCMASEAALAVANDALQLHGGYGYMREVGLEKLVRDLRAHPIVEGTNEIMRLIIARRLLMVAAEEASGPI